MGADPDKRPDSTILPEIFEMMLKDSINNGKYNIL